MKRGQLWYADVILAFLVVIIITLFFAIAFFDLVGREKEVQGLLEDSVTLTNSMMSPGYKPNNQPTDWCNNEGRIGFVNDMKINTVDLINFENLVDATTCANGLTGYEMSKVLLGTPYDYLIYFQKKDGNFVQSPLDGITKRTYGKYKVEDLPDPTTGIQNIFKAIDQDAPENKVNFFRFVYLDTNPPGDNLGEIVKMGVVLWS